MSSTEPTASTESMSPYLDLMTAAFFLIWAIVGWMSFFSNEPLRNSLGAGADPGPGLLPLITLSILTLGGLGIGIKGLVHLRTGSAAASSGDLPKWRDQFLPVGFATSVLITTVMMMWIGYLLSAFSFSVFWLFVLSGKPRLSVRNIVLALVLAAAMTGALYMAFAYFLLVPLP